MNIRRSMARIGPLIAAALALTAAAVVISPAPASAGTNVNCTMFARGPMISNGPLVFGDAYVTCFGGGASGINLSVILTRDGVVVASSVTGGTFGASAAAVAACVPGYYALTTSASIWYPFGNIPGSDYFYQQSPSVYFSCVQPVTVTVANPGTQLTYVFESAQLQMTASGGAAPYTWSATGLPTGLSINSSTGLISGLVRVAARTTVTVTAVDAAGHSGSTAFTWAVRTEPCPRC